jgi:hypothetical protein
MKDHLLFSSAMIDGRNGYSRHGDKDIKVPSQTPYIHLHGPDRLGQSPSDIDRIRVLRIVRKYIEQKHPRNT